MTDRPLIDGEFIIEDELVAEHDELELAVRAQALEDRHHGLAARLFVHCTHANDHTTHSRLKIMTWCTR